MQKFPASKDIGSFYKGLSISTRRSMLGWLSFDDERFIQQKWL